MHEFVVGQRRYGKPEGDDFGFGEKTLDERKATVGEIAPKAKKRFIYIYDMGDSWEHGVEVEKIEAAVGGVRYPACLDGARACPPEDSGGVPGYLDKLDAIKDDKHPDHDDILDWIGGDFDPELFDVNVANGQLAKVR